MRSSIVLTGLVSAAAAARPANESICDYYTTALLKDNTAANQQTLLTLVVNTAVIGNYTTPNVGVAVPGILTPGEFNGTKVNLLPYFDGMLASSNRGGSSGVSVNFLDGGAATPLENNMPANNTSSNQYTLLTHLYEYFAGLLGCSEYGNTTSPYAGFTSMYQVHKYMALDEAEVSYFIQQVGLSAASFGVADSDVAAVGKALTDAFGYRCAPPASIPATATPALQAICIASDCPIAPSATCNAYAPVVEPSTVSSGSSSPATSTGSAASSPATSTGSAVTTPTPYTTGTGVWPGEPSGWSGESSMWSAPSSIWSGESSAWSSGESTAWTSGASSAWTSAPTVAPTWTSAPEVTPTPATTAPVYNGAISNGPAAGLVAAAFGLVAALA